MAPVVGQAEVAAREERILDAAGELLLRIGYRRVTVEDIAQRADVGKGTVYLHWRSKRELLVALLLREIDQVMGVVVRRMRADPAEAQLHRMIRASFVAIMSRPLAKALYTRDLEVLGKLANSNVGGMRGRHEAAAMTFDAYLDLLAQHGLLRSDVDRKTLDYAIDAATSGFYLVEGLLSAEGQLSLEDKADCLADVVYRCFEPPGDPDPQMLESLAPRAITLFEQIRAELAPGVHQPAI